MEIRRVALIGAGAIGAYFIWGCRALPEDAFFVVAEGERRQRLLRDGIVINKKTYPLPVRTPEEAKGADLILVATKYAGLSAAVPEIQRILGENTIVMSLLNGVDSEEILAEKIGWEHIVNAYMVISSQRSGSEVHFDPAVTKGLLFGEKDTSEKTERCAAIEAFFQKTDVRAAWLPNIVQMQWEKYCRNIAYNIPQAVLGVGIGAFSDSEHVAHLSAQLENEVIAVGKAYGIEVPPLDRGYSGRYDKKSRYSTLQDLDAKRHTEVDMFCGVLIQKAKAKGVPVPAAEIYYHLIKALEEKNDGKFDY